MSTLGTGTENATWYYVGSFGQLGPLTLDQLEELVDGGVIERETYVWNPAMPTWLLASQVPQLGPALNRRMPHMEPPPTPTASSRSPLGGIASGVATPPRSPGMGSFSPPTFPSSSLAPGLPPGVSPATAANLTSAYSAYTSPYGMASDRSRTVGGILNMIVPGVGRMYLGYSALGVIQLLATVASCGILHIWSVIDGILMLTGQVKIDGYGRILKD